ncbi:hypothetical protein [Magnetospira sp. QH-2]|uniref:hypothetical protein n=1 Tax=Magnetospira sp. (strain QH-2) TaxID=1288970 RepID=UPI0003E8126B|nr:hypothetical protein [Magnetospira sp. QH-2]CCQ72499.1 protein of unknown function [Magnetospira sp. QH-2]
MGGYTSPAESASPQQGGSLGASLPPPPSPAPSPTPSFTNQADLAGLAPFQPAKSTITEAPLDRPLGRMLESAVSKPPPKPLEQTTTPALDQGFEVETGTSAENRDWINKQFEQIQQRNRESDSRQSTGTTEPPTRKTLGRESDYAWDPSRPTTDAVWQETKTRPIEKRSTTDILKGVNHEAYWDSNHPLHGDIQKNVGDTLKHHYPGKVDLSGGQSAQARSFHFAETRREEDQRLAKEQAKKAPRFPSPQPPPPQSPPPQSPPPQSPPSPPMAPIADSPPGYRPPPPTAKADKPVTLASLVKEAKKVAKGVLGPAYGQLEGIAEAIGLDTPQGAAETLSPGGDIQDMVDGSRITRDGIREGDFGKITQGLGTMTGSLIGMALPGRPGRAFNQAGEAIRETARDIKLPHVSKTKNPLSAEEFEALPDEGTIDPLRLRTMQSDIKRQFKTGGQVPLENTIDDIRNGKYTPPVRIVEIDRKVYTLDHRRVVAYRIAGQPIPYRKVSAIDSGISDEIKKKLTSRNSGMAVRIRGVK